MSLQIRDLTRLETASRLLTSPLAAPDPEAWLAEAGAAVCDLVGGTGVLLQFPTAPTPYFSVDSPDIVDDLLGFVQEVTWDGTRFSDPAVDEWSRIRQERQLETCSWDLNDALVRERGFEFSRTAFFADVMAPHRVHDYVALMGNAAEGEAMVWVLHDRRDGFRHGERTDGLLRALVPSFRAGLDALGRLGAHRAALDAVAEPVALFDADGREIHRNAALDRLMAADSDREGLAVEVRALAAALRPHAAPRRHECGLGPVSPTREVRTARHAYRLRGTILPRDLSETSGTLLVTVEAGGPVALPGPDAVRERLGLTAREAEVALLLAEGLTNVQLADRLFIAPATARRHTENVLGKLGVARRSGVAAALLAA